jgi:tRNA (adenine22-N1)-methyltransferase
VAEEIIEEDGKIYEVLVGEKGEPNKPYGINMEKDLLVGPFLSERKEGAFLKKWSLEKNNWQRIYDALESAAQSPETTEKKQELLNKIKLIEECLDGEDSERS